MRLIDADELIEHAWRDKLDSRELIVEMIEKAPTIKEIPTNIPIDVFEKLISQELRWIPTSERLPEEHNGYLVSLKQGYVTTALWVGNAGYWNEITAWMPLPESYKGD